MFCKKQAEIQREAKMKVRKTVVICHPAEKERRAIRHAIKKSVLMQKDFNFAILDTPDCSDFLKFVNNRAHVDVVVITELIWNVFAKRICKIQGIWIVQVSEKFNEIILFSSEAVSWFAITLDDNFKNFSKENCRIILFKKAWEKLF